LSARGGAAAAEDEVARWHRHSENVRIVRDNWAKGFCDDRVLVDRRRAHKLSRNPGDVVTPRCSSHVLTSI
jgi:hypothetical protein